MKLKIPNYSEFFKENKQQLYYTNINAVMRVSFFYILGLTLFIIAAFSIFTAGSFRTSLLITYSLMLLAMVVMLLLSRYIYQKQINKLKLSVFITYLSMSLNIIFIIIISIFIGWDTSEASFFIVFNIISPSLYILRKVEVYSSMIISAIIFFILSYLFRPAALLINDFYVALSSLIIGIPYNIMIYNVKLNDAYTKKLYSDQANLDELSGLHNRRSFNKKIKSIFSNFAFDNLALVILDLDDFKKLNDKLGHWHGDHIIKKVGGVLKQFGQENQIYIYRIGGDEFVLIALNIHLSRLKELLDDLLEKVTNIKLDYNEQLEASIGAFYSTTPRKYTAEEFFNQADHALYYVKANGKSSIQLTIDKK